MPVAEGRRGYERAPCCVCGQTAPWPYPSPSVERKEAPETKAGLRQWHSGRTTVTSYARDYCPAVMTTAVTLHLLGKLGSRELRIAVTIFTLISGSHLARQVKCGLVVSVYPDATFIVGAWY